MTKFLLLTLLAFVTACAAPPHYAPISFTGQPSITLAVQTIEIVDEYVPPMVLPNVDHAAPTPPLRAIHNWVNDRLHTIGASGYARIGIKDAHIVQVPAEASNTRYNGRIEVTIDASMGAGKPITNTNVVVERSITTDRGLSLQDKEKLWDDLVRQMMSDFDHGMNEAIQKNLSGFQTQSGGVIVQPLPVETAPLDEPVTALPLDSEPTIVQ